jgi:hypothetical protein
MVALLLDASGLHCQSNKCPHHHPHSHTPPPVPPPPQVKVSKSASTSSLVTIHVVGCQVVSRGKDGVTNHLGRKEPVVKNMLGKMDVVLDQGGGLAQIKAAIRQRFGKPAKGTMLSKLKLANGADAKTADLKNGVTLSASYGGTGHITPGDVQGSLRAQGRAPQKFNRYNRRRYEPILASSGGYYSDY